MACGGPKKSAADGNVIVKEATFFRTSAAKRIHTGDICLPGRTRARTGALTFAGSVRVERRTARTDRPRSESTLMKFSEVVDHASALSNARGGSRIVRCAASSPLDEEALEDLKAELIDAQRVATDEEDKVLVWTGGEGNGESAKRGIGKREVVSSEFSVVLTPSPQSGSAATSQFCSATWSALPSWPTGLIRKSCRESFALPGSMCGVYHPLRGLCVSKARRWHRGFLRLSARARGRSRARDLCRARDYCGFVQARGARCRPCTCASALRPV